MLEDQASYVVEKEGVIASHEYQAAEIPKVNASNANHTEGTLARPTFSFSRADLPQSKILSMARPLGLGVDSKIKRQDLGESIYGIARLSVSKKNEKLEFM